MFAVSQPGWAIPTAPPSGGVACWVDAQGGEVPPGAVPGGFDNEQLYVGRAQHEGALIPGKVVPSHGVCYVAWGGQEHGKSEYQVCTPLQDHFIELKDRNFILDWQWRSQNISSGGAPSFEP